MKHAREDYNRIQDPQGLIPKNEPVFLLRGQDMFAPDLVRRWATMYSNTNDPAYTHEMWLAVVKLADEMEKWQKSHKVKFPDM